MPAIGEADFAAAARLTRSFYSWEERGRGWQVWPYAVEIEPPFRPFVLSAAPPEAIIDDARKSSLLSAWLDELFGRRQAYAVIEETEIEEPEPRRTLPQELVAIQLALAPDVKITADIAEHFLLSLSTCTGPVSYEITGTSDAITLQFVCSEADSSQVIEQLRAHFPDAVIGPAADALREREHLLVPRHALVVDFGLSDEFMRPLRTLARFDADPLVAVTGALSDVQDDEIAVLQIMFQSARAPWNASILRSVTDWTGDAFFADAPELLQLAKEKIQRPLFAAVIRVAVSSRDRERQWQIAKRIGGALAQLSHPSSNELIALSNDDYPSHEHLDDVLSRQTHRSGAILNSEELVTLVHPPSTAVRTPRLSRGHRRTKAAPKALFGNELVLGDNAHGGVTRSVSLSTEQRLRHMHLVGASGTGKSTLLLILIVQDMERGNGVAVIDPHGDLVDELLGRIPESRIDDVILVDPADTDHPIGFNILSAHSELEKTLLSSDLVAVFRRLSTSWGDQMTSVLSNAVLAFLESDKGGTLADLRRFLIEPEYRKEFLETVQDREVVYYWQKEFPLLTGKPQAPLLTRLDSFLRPRLVRGMVTQPENRLDFASIMSEGKILLVKLAQGAIGEENAALLGTLFVAKIHQLALGRQAVEQSARRPFFVYLDEFQHFVTPSMATLLTGARKYGVGLVLAHQELRQLWNQDRDVAGAVLANAATRICFRVGDDDAKKLEDGFTTFSARDLQNLGVGQAVARVERAEWDFSLDTHELPPVDQPVARERREKSIRLSCERYGVRLAANIETDQSDPQPVSDAKPLVAAFHLEPSRPRSAPSISKDALEVMRRPGRGGAQHKYLQELIRRWAEANGWRATIEKPILDGLGNVDIALEHGEVSVACEIGISSSAEHEILNIQKCLSAGFNYAISVVPEPRKLKTLAEQLAQLLPDDSHRTLATSPERLFEFLGELVSERSTKPETVRGYRVAVKRGAANSRAARAKRGTLAKVVSSALSRLRS